MIQQRYSFGNKKLKKLKVDKFLERIYHMTERFLGKVREFEVYRVGRKAADDDC